MEIPVKIQAGFSPLGCALADICPVPRAGLWRRGHDGGSRPAPRPRAGPAARAASIRWRHCRGPGTAAAEGGGAAGNPPRLVPDPGTVCPGESADISGEA